MFPARKTWIVLALAALACAPERRPAAPGAAQVEPAAPGSEPRARVEPEDRAEPPQPAELPERTDARTLEALDAVLRGGEVVLVESDGAHVRALDVETGAERWRAPTGATARAALLSDLGGGRLLVQLPSRFVTVDRQAGRVVATRELALGWRFVFRNAGACALNGECDFTPIACDDARPLGAPLSIRRLELHDDRGRHASCVGERVVIGRAGELSLYAVGLEGRPAAEVIALDGAGAVRWRSEAVACASCTPLGAGVSSDGTLCWTTDRLERELVVRAFECATGRPRFTRRVTTPAGHRHPAVVTGWLAQPAGLVISAHEEVALIGRDGRVLWERRDVPARTLALPEGTRTSDYPLALDAYDAVARLRPADGSTARSEQRRDGEIRAIEGAIALVPPGATYDRAGGHVEAPERFSFVRSRTGSRALLEARTVLTLEGDGWVTGEHRSERGAWLVITEPREGLPDRLHVLRDALPRPHAP